MSFPNIPPSDRVNLAAVIDPQSATTAKTSTYVRLGGRGFHAALAIGKAGAFAAGAKLNAKLVQAQDDGGTGEKDITGKAITELTDADDNKQFAINVRAEELDRDNGFEYVALVMTPSVDAVLIDGAILGLDAAYEPLPSAEVLATLDEVVS